MLILKTSGAHSIIRSSDFVHAHAPPPLPPSSAFKLKDTLAVFGAADAGRITRRQIVQRGELIKVTDGFKRMNEGS